MDILRENILKKMKKTIGQKVKKKIELSHLKNAYKMLFKHFPVACMVCDFDGLIIEANEFFYKMLHCTEDDITNQSIFDFMKFEQTDIGTVYLNSLMKGKTAILESSLITCIGEIRGIEVTLIPFMKNQILIGMFIVLLDNTEKNQLKEKLTKLKENLSYGEQLAQIGSWTYNLQEDEIFLSDGIYNILECNPQEFDGKLENLYSNVHSNDLDMVREAIQGVLKGREYDIEYRVATPYGREKLVQERTKVLYDKNNKPVKIIGVIQEINGYIDELTKLPNRAYFMKQIKFQSEEARANSHSFALIMLDIDGFEYINNALGDQLGDQLIVQIADRLKNFLGDDKFICRYSEDQFAIIARGLNSTEKHESFARDIMDLFSSSFKVGKYELNITVCLGISIYPDDGQDADTLEKNANIALFRSKSQGRNRYQFHSHDTGIQNYKQFVLRNDLLKAIEKFQLKVYYQPQVNLQTGEIVAAEALIRWEHPYLGLVPPNEFIYIAEETGFINNLGKWMLREVCRNYKKWLNDGLPAIKVSVNCSCIQFHEKDFVENIKRTLDEFELDPHFLIIEITESFFMSNSEKAVSDIRTLRSLGVQVALDDFGTGFSSLAYLSSFNIDILKLDRSFIQDVPLDDTNSIITSYIANLAEKLGIELVAEGIETWEQLSYLQKLNCCSGQGFLYSKPLPQHDFEKLLAKKKCKPSGMRVVQETEFNERRKFFRINLPQSLEADVNIIEIEGQRVKIGNSKGLIKNIGLGGLAFVSTAKIPIKRSIILQFITQLLDTEIRVYGCPVWTKEISDNLHEYGVEFTFDENERIVLSKVLNQFQDQLIKGSEFNNGRFVSDSLDKYFNSENVVEEYGD